MSGYVVSLKIDATAAEAGSQMFLAAVNRIRQGFDGLGGAGQQIERATQALFNFRKARDAIEQAAGVSGRSDTVQRAADIDAYGKEIDRLRAKYVPLAAQQQQYLATLREIQAAQRGGALSAAEAANAIDQTKAAFAAHVTAARAAGSALQATGESARFLQARAQTLVYTLSDVSASLASGASPFMILMQQGGQVAQVFTKAAGGPGLMAAALSALTSPITLAVTALAALAAVTGAVLLRSSDMATESRKFSGELQATGRQAELTTKQLHDMVEAMRDAGVAKADARDAISASLRAPGLDSARVQQIAALTPNAAAGLGTDAATAAKALADIAANGYPAIERFALANNALDASQLKVIRSLAQQGDQVGAVSKALEMLGDRYKDLAENSLSPIDKSLNNIGRAWTGFIDRIASSSTVLDLINRAAESIELIDRVTGGRQSTESLQKEKKQLLEYQSPFPFLEDGLPALFGAKTQSQRSTERLAEIDRQLGLRRPPQGSTNSGNPLPGTSEFVGPMPVSSPANQRTAQEVELEKANEDLQRRLAVLSASPINRSVVQAREEIAARADLKGDITDPNSEKGRAAIIAETRARAELAAVVRDQTAAVNANVAGNLAAADAYQTSSAAGIEADARRQAGVEALTQAINVNVRTREILAERISGEIAAASQQIETNRNEAANAERLADAQKLGAAAYADAELAIKQQTATQQYSVSIQVAERNGLTELADRLRALKGEREEQIATIEKSNRATQQSIDLRKADQEVALAQKGAAAAQIIDPGERRAAEIAIERQREMNRLLESGKKTTEEIGELMQRWDIKTAADEQTRFWNDVRQQSEGASKDVSGFLTDGLVNATNGGKSSFKNMFDAALQGGKRFFARMAATALEQKIILPIAMQVVGGIPQAFGIAMPQGQGGGASGGSTGGFQFPGFGGGGFSGITNSINDWGARNLGTAPSATTAATNAFNQSPEMAYATSTPVPTGTTLMQYGGAAVAGITGLMQLMNAKSAGGVVSGVSGLASAAMFLNPATAPFAPFVALGGNLLGGLLGNKKPTVGPGGGMQFGLDASGVATAGITDRDNGYDPVKANQSAANSVGEAAAALFKKMGMTFQGTVKSDGGGYLGYDAGAKKYIGGESQGTGQRFDTIEQAIGAALAGAVKNAKLEGVSEALTAKFRAVNSAADLESLVAYVANLRGVYDAFKDWSAPLTEVETTVNALKAAFEQAKSAANELGLSTTDLTKSYDKQMSFLRDQLNAALDERYARATGRNTEADLMVADRAAAKLRAEAAALGGNAIVKAEQTIQAERLNIILQGMAGAKAVEQQAAEARAGAMNSVISSITNGLNQALAAWQSVADSVAKFASQLGLSNLSPLSPEDQLALAKSQYSDLLGKALGGDVTAAQGVQGAAQSYLEKGRNVYASTTDYTKIYNSVLADLTGLTSFAGGDAQAQASAAASAQIRAIRDSFAPVKGFDAGGFHGGGLRIVGERQPELEATGPSRIWTANQIRDSLTSGGADPGLKEAINGLSRDFRTLIDVIVADGRINDEQQNRVLAALQDLVGMGFMSRTAPQ